MICLLLGSFCFSQIKLLVPANGENNIFSKKVDSIQIQKKSLIFNFSDNIQTQPPIKSDYSIRKLEHGYTYFPLTSENMTFLNPRETGSFGAFFAKGFLNLIK